MSISPWFQVRCVFFWWDIELCRVGVEPCLDRWRSERCSKWWSLVSARDASQIYLQDLQVCVLYVYLCIVHTVLDAHMYTVLELQITHS